MKLAVNYSPQTAELVQAGKIQLDFFKCPPWANLVAEAQEIGNIQIHFELRAGTGRLHETHWEVIEDYLTQTSTPYINLHLAPMVSDYPGMKADTQEPADVQRVMDNLLNDVCAVVDHFDAEHVIAENVTYLGSHGRFLRSATLLDSIQRVFNETGCGLLLDIAHARITAHYLGVDPVDYISNLPVNHLRELHFTGIHETPDGPQDHLSLLDTDWPWLVWTIEQIQSGKWARPWLLAFEYGGIGEFFGAHCDPDVLATQVPKLWEICQRV